MEVLDNGGHMKDSENQAAGSNFPCRLPRDLNIGSSTVSRNKSEADVRLLIACKAQLSSEVVRLKTENLRLQKEKDSARLHAKELEQIIGKFSERTRELENRLYATEEENKRLKGRMLGISNASALQKLSLNFDKFHSYPWTENQTNPLVSENSCLSTVETKKNSPPQEDWKEVSQKLLEQMKREMKELQEMSSSFSLQEDNNSEVTTADVGQQSCELGKVCDETIEESLSSLMIETESLKRSLLHQRKTLKLLMHEFIQGTICHSTKDSTKDPSKAFKTFDSSMDPSTSSVKPKSSVNQSSKHSDDSFRAFFTKHLEGCQNIDKMTKTMQLFMQTDTSADLSKSTQKLSSTKSSRSQTEESKNISDKGPSEEDRVCPICQASFDASVPQKQFEEHVVNHLEVESASLLDQYVVI